jgi:hypothetical protein
LNRTTPAPTLVCSLQTITDYKGKHSREFPNDTNLPDELKKEDDRGLQETAEHPPTHSEGTVVEKVEVPRVHITDKMKWSTHTNSVVKKVQQRLFNLRRLKKFCLSPKTLTNLYRSILSAVSLPGTATAPPSTAGLSVGWCSLQTTCPLRHLQHPMS